MAAENIFNYILLIIFVLLFIFISLTPLYALGKFLTGFSKSNNFLKKFFNNFFLYSLYFFIGILASITSIITNNQNTPAGEALTIYSNSFSSSEVHQAISSQSTISILFILILGIVCCFILKIFAKKLSPILYVLCSSALILTIIFTIFFIIQIFGNFLSTFGIMFGFATLSFFYLDVLRESLMIYIESESNNVYLKIDLQKQEQDYYE